MARKSSAARKPLHPWQEGLTRWAPYVVLVLAVCAAYANIYHNEFLFDDFSFFVENRFVRDWGYLPYIFVAPLTDPAITLGSYFRPVQTFLYMVVFHLAGMSPVAFHILNLSLHILNALLVYRLGRTLGFGALATFLAALVWALHPTAVEAITYMSATADTLYVTFCLAGMLALLPDISPRRVLAAVPWMALAMLSKESAIVFPFLAMSCLYFHSEQRLNWRIYLRLWPLFAAAVAYGAYRMIFVPIPNPSHSFAMIGGSPVAALTQTDYEGFAAIPSYLRLLVWPSDLHYQRHLAAYPTLWDIHVLAGTAIVFLVAIFIMHRQNKRSLPFAWGLSWFAAAHSLTFNISGFVYEHFLYLPSIGLLLGGMQSLFLCIEKMPKHRAVRMRRGAIIMAVLIAPLLGVLTYRQNEAWRNSATLYGTTFKYGELSPRSHINLGVYYKGRAEHDKALKEFEQAAANLEKEDMSPADRAILQTDWGEELLALPNFEDHAQDALAHFQAALKLNSESYVALSALARYYAVEGDEAQAGLYRSRAEAIRRHSMVAHDKDFLSQTP